MSRERSDPWPTMVVMGILCGLALGAVFVLLFRRGGSQPLLGAGGAGADEELEAYLPPLPAPPHVPTSRSTKIGQPRVVPIARTIPLANGRATMILQAVGPKDWTIWVRVLGPPGAEVRFMIGNNTGDAAQIPAGGFQQMMIPRGEYLYAMGSVAGVSVSVSGGAA